MLREGLAPRQVLELVQRTGHLALAPRPLPKAALADLVEQVNVVEEVESRAWQNS